MILRKDSSVASVCNDAHLDVDVAEGDAAQQRTLPLVVEHAQAVRAALAAVHEQVVQRPRPQRHVALRSSRSA